MTSKIKYT